jgi:hypothetical protein
MRPVNRVADALSGKSLNSIILFTGYPERMRKPISLKETYPLRLSGASPHVRYRTEPARSAAIFCAGLARIFHKDGRQTMKIDFGFNPLAATLGILPW